MKLATPAGVIVPAGTHVVAVCVNVEPAGNLSLVETLNVPGCPGWPVLVSFTASITGLLVVPVQFVHVGSPPPVTVAVFTVGFAAFAATATGTVITTGPLVPEAIEQPARLVAPLPGQPESVPPVAVIAPLVVTPAGNVSLTLIAAVVGPFATAIVIV